MKRQNHRLTSILIAASLLFLSGFGLSFSANIVPAYAASGGYLSAQPAGSNNCQDAKITSSNCGIVKYLLIFIRLLTGLVGVAVVGSIIVGGIQYTTAADDPQAIAKAKSRIYSAILALIVFIFFFSLLQWLVPGGVI